MKIRKGARLPHWTLEGAVYAVTFRLGDSLPRSILDKWTFERKNIVKTAEQMGRPLSPNEETQLNYLYSEKVGKFLDAGHGRCWMKEDRIANIVAGSLRHFDGERYDLHVWCVMPNHVHVVVKPHSGHELSKILHSWKSFSAHEANKILKRKGKFWEVEYYDHLIRNEVDYAHCIEYVLANPEKAGLKNWKWVSSID
ncbi:transposase [bacterium]|nr:transposase [bacterium]